MCTPSAPRYARAPHPAQLAIASVVGTCDAADRGRRMRCGGRDCSGATSTCIGPTLAVFDPAVLSKPAGVSVPMALALTALNPVLDAPIVPLLDARVALSRRVCVRAASCTAGAYVLVLGGVPGRNMAVRIAHFVRQLVGGV